LTLGQLEEIARLPKLKSLSLVILDDESQSLNSGLSAISTSDSLEVIMISCAKDIEDSVAAFFSGKSYDVRINGNSVP
jgi:hypothetical protein